MSANNRRLVFTNAADAGIVDIFAFTEERCGRHQADLYKANLQKTCLSLLNNPHLGRIVHRLSDEMRTLVVNRHIIVYRVIPEVVVIPRALSQRMDVNRPITLE